MPEFQRFAIYAVPRGELYRLGTDWLGWDCEAGAPVTRPGLPGLPEGVELVSTPSRYGFHATIKPPFRLRAGQTRAGLEEAFGKLCSRLEPVEIGRLKLAALGRFFALIPVEQPHELNQLAGRVLRDLDHFRAPMDATELDRRRKPNLSARQEQLLLDWGYPHVLDQFRFHLTLTGRLPKPAIEPVRRALANHFAPELEHPLRLGDLALVGEDAESRFHLILRARLGA